MYREKDLNKFRMSAMYSLSFVIFCFPFRNFLSPLRAQRARRTWVRKQGVNIKSQQSHCSFAFAIPAGVWTSGVKNELRGGICNNNSAESCAGELGGMHKGSPLGSAPRFIVWQTHQRSERKIIITVAKHAVRQTGLLLSWSFAVCLFSGTGLWE